MRDDTTYLKHILEAINTIGEYIAGMDYDQFSGNKMAVDAVVRELEIIGEAAGNLSADFRKNNPALPVKDAVDMRNFLIHEYFGVNKKIVWDTCQKELAPLKDVIASLLQ
jgi:uncharacterized protein with HEPN domain